MTILLATYIGYLSAIHHCIEFNCRAYGKPKPTPCEIVVNPNNEAKVFGMTFPLKRVAYGRTTIWEGWYSNKNLTIYFRPSHKILRAYISEYEDKTTYKRVTCDFGRQQEPGW